jgi:hypothetical protein
MPVGEYTRWDCGESVPPPVNDRDDVAEVRDSGPSLGEDGAGVRVDFAEADCPPPGPLEPEVEAADAREP